MTVHPIHPLPPDLQQLIDSSGEDGFIVVSFGYNVASILDKEKIDIMAKAFGRLKQTVIWRQQGICFGFETRAERVQCLLLTPITLILTLTLHSLRPWNSVFLAYLFSR